MHDWSGWVFAYLIAVVVVWTPSMLYVGEPFVIRPIVRALTGAQFKWVIGGPSNNLIISFVITNREEIRHPSLLGFFYWLLFWTLTWVLPGVLGLGALYVLLR